LPCSNIVFPHAPDERVTNVFSYSEGRLSPTSQSLSRSLIERRSTARVTLDSTGMVAKQCGQTIATFFPKCATLRVLSPIVFLIIHDNRNHSSYRRLVSNGIFVSSTSAAYAHSEEVHAKNKGPKLPALYTFFVSHILITRLVPSATSAAVAYFAQQR
jgi:hypothetical protein